MRRGIAIGLLITGLAGAGDAAWAQPGAGAFTAPEPPLGAQDSGESCEPGFAGCSIDPDG